MPAWRLPGSVAARMDASTLKRSRSCESSSERLLEVIAFAALGLDKLRRNDLARGSDERAYRFSLRLQAKPCSALLHRRAPPRRMFASTVMAGHWKPKSNVLRFLPGS